MPPRISRTPVDVVAGGMSQPPQTIADFTATLPNGESISLADRLGKVVLVVNTAS